jgi:hypothetical protein
VNRTTRTLLALAASLVLAVTAAGPASAGSSINGNSWTGIGTDGNSWTSTGR